ncbi:MAG TPA: hypothetical protein VL866_07885, partial [Pyrinomonadaceae bacterium]|nr:hypothetical protein [Pyrinomonadaceae bacterium]
EAEPSPHIGGKAVLKKFSGKQELTNSLRGERRELTTKRTATFWWDHCQSSCVWIIFSLIQS